MLDFNPLELLVIVIVCLLVYKPENLVEMLVSVMKWIRSFKQMIRTVNQGVSKDIMQIQDEITKLQKELDEKTQPKKSDEHEP